MQRIEFISMELFDFVNPDITMQNYTTIIDQQQNLAAINFDSDSWMKLIEDYLKDNYRRTIKNMIRIAAPDEYNYNFTNIVNFLSTYDDVIDYVSAIKKVFNAPKAIFVMQQFNYHKFSNMKLKDFLDFIAHYFDDAETSIDDADYIFSAINTMSQQQVNDLMIKTFMAH